VRFKFTFLHGVGIFLIGGLVWAATTPGGVMARRDDILDVVQGVIDDATTDPGLKRAASYYNDRYARDASYPNLSDEEVREDPEAGWGIGVEVEWCSSNAIVLHSLTGRGTISRLLVSGDDLGDVPGKVLCPADLVNPLPWRYREP
jgi:hypothetical protein